MPATACSRTVPRSSRSGRNRGGCGGWRQRGATSDYRYYEVAGTSHLDGSSSISTLYPSRTRCSTAVDRAALRNLIAWIDDGTEPPSSDYVELESAVSVVPVAIFRGFRNAVHDADGDVVGGPGAPPHDRDPPERRGRSAAGAYRGTGSSRRTDISSSEGTHSVRPGQARRTLPGPPSLVERVAKAAHGLVQRREILQEDADAYIRGAAHSTMGMTPR